MKKIKLASIPYLLLFGFSISILAQENNNLKSLLLSGEYQKVINILEQRITEQDSLSFDEYSTIGQAYQRIMNFSKAVPFLYNAHELEPKNIQTLLLLGNCYNSLGNNVMAKFSYNKILDLDSNNIMAMVSLGKVFIELDEFNVASNVYKKLIDIDSSNSYYFEQLGICELKKGNKDLAKKYFGDSFALNSSNTKTILRLAKLYINDKQLDEASKLLQFGLTKNSKNKSLNKMLADVFYKKKQYEEAIIKYLYAITIGDTTARTYQKLGMSYYYLSFNSGYQREEVRKLKLNEGVEALIKAYNKEDTDPINTLYLGLCYKELTQHEEAIKYFEETLNKVLPDYMDEIYSNLGSSYGETKNYIESIKAYKKALNYNPTKTTLYFYLANVYDNYYEDKSVAVLYYQKFIDESIDADENLIGYSLHRINTLTKEAKFWGK